LQTTHSRNNDVENMFEEDSDLLGMYEQILLDAKRSVAVINLDYAIVWVNNTAINTFGYSLAECMGQRVSELIFGNETAPDILEKAVNAVENRKTVSYEHIAYKKDGSKIWLDVTLKPLYNRDKIIDKYCLYGSDITQKKELEKKAEEAEKRLSLLLKHTPDIVYSIDNKGKITDVNEAWTNILGYSREETLAKNGNHFFYPADIDIAKAARQSLVDGLCLSYNIDIRVVAKDGSIVWLNTTSVPILSTSNEIIGFTGISKNITVKKRNLLIKELLATHIRGMISLNDENRNYLYVSPSFKELTGWDSEDLIGKNSFDYYHPDDILRITNYRNANIKGEIQDDETLELRYRKKDGTYTWIELSARWFHDPYEDAMRSVISAQPLNKKKQEEEKLLADLANEKKLNKLKSSFVSLISHEFRTPLAIIKAICELLKMQLDAKGAGLEQQLEEDLGLIENEINGLTSLIDDVLILEKIEKGDVTLQCKPVRMQTLILPILQRFAIKHKDRKEIILNKKGTPKLVFGDAQYLELIFSNLLSNAYKYSKEKPEPIVTVNYEESYVVISIKDFGIGIPEKNKKKLFTDFFRGDNVRDTEGTGLGLSIAKKFVEMHRGKIICISKENEGTEMIVSLPVCESELI